MAKIVIISDVYHSVAKPSDVYDAEHISEKLLSSVSEDDYGLLVDALEGEKEPADVLVFCGDYVVGSESIDKKRQAMKDFVAFLEKVENSDKIIKGDNKARHIVIVPGNHDINRGEDGIYETFKDKTSRYLTPFSKGNDHHYAPTFVFDSLELVIDRETTSDNSSTLNERVGVCGAVSMVE